MAALVEMTRDILQGPMLVPVMTSLAYRAWLLSRQPANSDENQVTGPWGLAVMAVMLVLGNHFILSHLTSYIPYGFPIYTSLPHDEKYVTVSMLYLLGLYGPSPTAFLFIVSYIPLMLAVNVLSAFATGAITGLGSLEGIRAMEWGFATALLICLLIWAAVRAVAGWVRDFKLPGMEVGSGWMRITVLSISLVAILVGFFVLRDSVLSQALLIVALVMATPLLISFAVGGTVNASLREMYRDGLAAIPGIGGVLAAGRTAAPQAAPKEEPPASPPDGI